MSQVPRVTEPVEERSSLLFPVCPYCCQYFSVVRIHDHAGIRIYNIVEASPLVHSKRQGAFLKRVTEGKLHFVAVAVYVRAPQDSVKPVHGTSFRHSFLKKFTNLPFLDPALFFIWKTQISASSAYAEYRAGNLTFKRRSLEDGDQRRVSFSFSLFIDPGLYFLACYRIFDNADTLPGLNDPFIGKFHFPDNAFDQVSFFQILSPSRINRLSTLRHK